MNTITAVNKPKLIASDILLGTLEAAEELGIDLRSTLAEYGIEKSILQSSEGFLDFYQVVNFLDKVSRVHNCQHFGFLVGKYQPPLRYGVATQTLKLAPNIKTAIENNMRYSNLYSEGVQWRLHVADGLASYIRHDLVPCQNSLTQLHFLGVTLVFKMMQQLCGKDWKPKYISLAHPPPAQKKQCEAIFKVPIYFDQGFNGLVFLEEDLSLPIKTRDHDLLAVLQSHLDALARGYEHNDTAHLKVRHYIRQYLGTNKCNLANISQFFSQHPRSLQRELAKFNYTFKELLTDVRHEVAEDYLRNSNITLVELAEILGYRNVSAFSRAFKNYCGTAPAHKRNNLNNLIEKDN